MHGIPILNFDGYDSANLTLQLCKLGFLLHLHSYPSCFAFQIQSGTKHLQKHITQKLPNINICKGCKSGSRSPVDPNLLC